MPRQADSSTRYFSGVRLLLMTVLMLAGLAGCQEEAIIPLRAHERETSLHSTDYLDYAVGNLYRLPQFPPHEILPRIVSRLNQWSKSESPTVNWQLDELVATLPPNLQPERLLKELSSSEYSSYDAVFLREAVIMRAIAKNISGDITDDVASARRLFEWTVANVDLDPEPESVEQDIAQMPWHSVVFGHGRAIDRAWIFVLLARQLDLDVVFLYLPHKDGLGGTERLWCTALVSDEKLYLFDPAYGLPLPGAEPGSVATLRELAANDALLRQLDREGAPYPVKASDLKQVPIYIEGGRQYLSQRMKNIQMKLSLKQRVVITSKPSAIADRLKGIPNLARPRLWPSSYRAERMFSSGSQTGAQSPSFRAVQQQMKSFESVPRVTGRINPLWSGRLQHFAGQYTTQPAGQQPRSHDAPPGQKGAKPRYLHSRVMMRYVPDDRITPEQRAALVRRVTAIKRDGSYWLAMIAMDEQNYELAQFYLAETQKLESSEAWPKDTPKRATQMSLARAYEANGQADLAISHYLGITGPAAMEAQIRAARLAAANGKQLDDYAAVMDALNDATTDPTAAEDAKPEDTEADTKPADSDASNDTLKDAESATEPAEPSDESPD